MSPFSKQIKTPKSQQIKSLLNCAKHEYRNDLSPIHLPNQLSYKINGIWELDVRLFRAINAKIYRLQQDDELKNINECQMHISMWSKLPQRHTQKKEKKKFNDIDIDADDDDEIKYDIKYNDIEADEEILQIIEDCRTINIEHIMQDNKHKNVMKISMKNDVSVYDNIDAQIQHFIDEICEGPALPVNGYAIMILFDTRNADKINAYIWREELNANEYKKEAINIGDNRIKSKANNKRKYFEFDVANNKVNVGQYVGMDICMLQKQMHQFWTIFNTETRFEPSHALDLWKDYYIYESMFEATRSIDDEWKYYNYDCAETGSEQRNLYRMYYDNEFIDKLNDKNVIFSERELLLERSKLCESADDKIVKIPDLNDYKPFLYHLRRSKYAKYYGESFIVKLNDKTTKFDQGELLEQKQNGDNNVKAPKLDRYGPFKFHWEREDRINEFEQQLSSTRPIINLNPKNFEQLYDDATNGNVKRKKKK